MIIQKNKLSVVARSEALEGSSLSSSLHRKAPSELHPTQGRLSLGAAFNALEEPVWIMDAECRIQCCNRAAQKLYGHNIVGRYCWEVVHGATERVAGCPLLGRWQSCRRESIELPVGARCFNCTVDPLFGADGKFSGAVHVMWDFMKDMTKHTRLAETMEHERQLLRALAEENLRQSEARYRTLFDTLIEGFCTIEMIYDAAGKPVDYRFLEVNPAFEKQTGLKNAQGCRMRELAPDHEAHWFEIYGKIARTGEPAHFENEARALGRCYDVYAYRVGGPDSRKVAILFNDITRRKRSEKLLQRANQTLQAIRGCHEAMLRADTEKKLLDEICRIIVQTGGERMAWVGYAEKDARKTVRPVAEAGVRKDYLEKARITWADQPRGRGPVGAAIRTGKVCITRNTQTDPSFVPWRDSARRYGYGSVISLPLISDGECFGALSIYSPKPDDFDEAEQQLLTDLANDLAFGITTLRLRAERERLEDEILKSAEREQERIGRDLHDSLCQLLTGAKFRSAYLAKIEKEKFSTIQREAGALEKILNQAIEQTRDLVRGLNPVKALPDGLAVALQQLADHVDGPHAPHCFCHIPELVKISDHHVACHLYRIAQEAVQNALKHARAKNISIALTRTGGRVTLTVKDDGVGIASAGKKSGMGLGNMRTRARLIGGRLEIRRRKHGGTAVTCELPLKSRRKP